MLALFSLRVAGAQQRKGAGARKAGAAGVKAGGASHTGVAAGGAQHEESEEEHFWDGGSAPKPPRFIAFAPGFLDWEASCD